MGFVYLRQAILDGCAGHSQSLAMDLHDQHVYMGKTGQWRFTPPTHVIASFDQALVEHEAEGGVAVHSIRKGSLVLKKGKKRK